MKVWGRPVRVLHWVLVASMALGGCALAVAALRRFARIAQFVRAPRAAFAYLRQMWLGCEPRHLGHNPLGAWMILALLLCVVMLCVTGWLYTTDALWGDARVEMLHRGLTWGLLGLVALHVGGVIFTSLRQRENLVLSMRNGEKRAPRGDDVA